MDRDSDLDSALSFVIDRIEEQAKLSVESLTDEQRLLLKYLPSSSPQSWDLEIPVLVPRDINFERVCALGKAVYQYDRQTNPASLDWDFAFAVFTLYRHPMRGFLQWIGMKLRRPKWGGLALIVTALLPRVAAALIVWNADGPLLLSVGIGSACLAIMLLMFWASRRKRKRGLEEDIERYRLRLALLAP
jgi:hypothetical protein